MRDGRIKCGLSASGRDLHKAFSLEEVEVFALAVSHGPIFKILKCYSFFFFLNLSNPFYPLREIVIADMFFNYPYGRGRREQPMQK
jgi:hypothetical protein